MLYEKSEDFKYLGLAVALAAWYNIFISYRIVESYEKWGKELMKRKICERILKRVQIVDHKGTVRLCGWLYDDIIGSLSNEDMKEIYHGERARELRRRLGEGDYTLCRTDACPYLSMGDIEEHLVELDSIPEYPEELYLAYENTCNYRCTCCGVPDIIKRNCTHDLQKDYDAIEERLRDILPYIKRIGANGLGELFTSKNTLNLLANWKPLASPQEISVELESNGSLFDEKHWKQIENLGQYHLSVYITVMSFDEPTYQFLSGTKLPISQIENNLRFVKKLREQGVINFLSIATVIQERNFRTMPEFARRCVEEFGADYVRLRPYEPWGGHEPEIEWFMDVRNPEHPYYNEYKEVMSNDIFKNPHIFDWSGGRDTVNVRKFPYKSSYLKENILAQLILHKSCIIERLGIYSESESILVYGLGNIGKVLVKILEEKSITPIYILDKNKPCEQFLGIQVFSLEDKSPLICEATILITPLEEVEKIESDLTALGYEGRMIRIKDLIKNL